MHRVVARGTLSRFLCVIAALLQRELSESMASRFPRRVRGLHLDADPTIRRMSVSLTHDLHEKLLEFRLAISRGRPLPEAEAVRQLLEYALENHPRPAPVQR